jgi:hypothetical protein
MGGEVDPRAPREEVVERGAAATALQAIDAAEPAIVEHDDVQLLIQHHGSRDLRIHHQIGAVADQNPNLTFGHGELGAEPAGNFVPHARVAVFDVVGADLSAAPQFVQFTRQAASGADDHIPRARHPVYCSAHLRIAR